MKFKNTSWVFLSIVFILSGISIYFFTLSFNLWKNLSNSDFLGNRQVAQVANISIFGLNSTSGSTGVTGRLTCAGPFVPTYNGTLQSISAYLSASSAAKAGFALYDDNGSGTAPGTLLVSDNGNPSNIDTSPTWVTSNLTYSLTAGKNYWLCYFPNISSITYYYRNSSVSNIIQGSVIYSSFENWPNSFTINSSGSGREQLIYASYLTDAAQSPVEQPPVVSPPPSIGSPVISLINANVISSSDVSISWATDIDSTSQIEYGITTTYGNQTVFDSNLTKTHSQAISGLQANTTYHFRIHSKNSLGDETISNDQTFMTASLSSLIVPNLFFDDVKDWYGSLTTINAVVAWDKNTTDRMALDYSSDGVNFTEDKSWSPVGSQKMNVQTLPYNVKSWFKIRAVIDKPRQYSDFSNTVTLVSLFPPSGLKVTTKSKTSVYLTWDFRGATDSNGNQYELLPGSLYKLERSTNSSFSSANTEFISVSQPYDILPNPNNASKNIVTFTDNYNFSPGTTYYYRVRASTNVGDGVPSNPVSIAPSSVPDPVDYVEIFTTKNSSNNKSSNNVSIMFTDSSVGQTGYRIDRSTDATNWSPIKSYGLSIPSDPYIDGGLTPGSTYYYRVVAINDSGDSSYTVKKIILPTIVTGNVNNWYVDNQVSGGTNDGTSWTNAWSSLSGINWYSIKPGDNIYISGGSSGKTYDELFNISQSGSSGNQINIKVGIDSNHSGKVKVTKGVLIRGSYITLDGSKYSNFSFSNLENIVNNQNFEVQNPYSHCVFASAPTGVKLLWLEVDTCGSNIPSVGVVGAFLSDQGSNANGLIGSEIAYSRIHDVNGFGVQATGKATMYGLSAIHHNIIEYIHDDFMDAGGGVDVYNNIGRRYIDPRPSGGHPDGFQIWAPYIRIYNNIIYDTPGTLIYIEQTFADSSHIQIFNNIIYPSSIIANSGITFTTEPHSYVGSMSADDILIANNLIYNLNKPLLSLNLRTELVGSLNVSNMTVKNNIFYLPSAFAAGNYVNFQGNINYLITDLVYDNNIMTGSYPVGIMYKGISYSKAEDFSTAIKQYPNNVSLIPKFINSQAFDFRLTSADTIAKDRGSNLLSFCTSRWGWSDTNCPLRNDILGTVREALWDIGPYEYYDGQPAVPVISMPPPVVIPTPDPVLTPIPSTYTLTVNKSGSGTGTVTGGSINCGSTCTQSGITSGTSITLTATPSTNNTFVGWSGACTGTGNCTVNMSSNNTVTATFGLGPDTTPPTIALNTIPNSTNLSGSIVIGAIATDPVISGQITSGVSTVQFMLDNTPLSSPLTTPASGNTYSGTWDTTKTSNGSHIIKAIAIDGAGKTTISNSITVIVNNQAVVIPTIPTTYTLTVGKAGSGTGTVNGGSINCGSTCTQSGITSGTSITLTATPSTNNTFVGWSGACTGTGNCTVNMSSNNTVTANFTTPTTPVITDTPLSYTLTIGKSGIGTGLVRGASIDCGSVCTQTNILSGTSITLNATPLGNSTFKGWSGISGCSGLGDCRFTILAHTTINADFSTPPALTPEEQAKSIFLPLVPQLPISPVAPITNVTPKNLYISSLLVSSRTNTGVTISWSTSQVSNAKVNYGLTKNYGDVSQTQTNSTYHTMVLNNLKPNTTYHFNLVSKDIYNNVVSTEDYTFSTLTDSTNKYVTISTIKKPISTSVSVSAPKKKVSTTIVNNKTPSPVIDLTNLGEENATSTSTTTPIFTKIKNFKWLQWIKDVAIYTYERVIDGMIDFGNLIISNKNEVDVYSLKN